MRRRSFIAALGGTAAAWPLRALAQASAKIVRIGLLSAGAPLTDDSDQGKALIHGLGEHGYVPGKNLTFERRGAGGKLDRLPQLVAELRDSKVDVIITSGYPSALAAKQETAIPVVVVNAGDPVGTGLASSLARPGGHVTGISDVSAEVTPKRLELLKEFAPNLRHVAVLWNADDLGMTLRYRASEAAAKALNVEIEALGVREPDDFNQAFAAMDRGKPDGILMVTDSLTILNRKRVFDYAAAHRLPAIYEFDFLVRDGGLMSYGPDTGESYERVGALVDRILKGANPGELPFEQPTVFRFVLNLKTAKSIGFEPPVSLVASADEVIE